MRLIIGEKNPTEELTTHMFFTLVVGYFVCAQYDVKSPIGGVAATSPEGGSKICLCERSEAISREGEFPQSIYFSLWSWDISLALNMTCFFTLSLQGGVATAAIPSKKYAVRISKEKANFISTDICGSVYPKTFRGYCTTNEFILQAF